MSTRDETARGRLDRCDGSSTCRAKATRGPLRILVAAIIVTSWLAPVAHAGGSRAYAGHDGRSRTTPSKDLCSRVRPGLERPDWIVVKFKEGASIRLRDGSLRSLDPEVRMNELESWIRLHPDVRIERHFSRSEVDLDHERSVGEANGSGPLADLNLYFRFILPASADVYAQARTWLAELAALPQVEVAFAEPIAIPAARGSGQATALLSAQPSRLPPERVILREHAARPATPDFEGLQGYLGPAPSGINARAVWGLPGGRGAGVRVLDIEGAWVWNHEDLKPPFFTAGTPSGYQFWRDHGTAVMGEMAGQNNGYGVTGICSDIGIGGVAASMSCADAVNIASSGISVGDIFLIELHGAGPNADNPLDQHGYVPMEFWQDVFDAIRMATANGRICVEAGGNGEQDLDDPIYEGLFDRDLRYSGAVLVGAGTPNTGEAEWFSNHGSRFDLNGWGSLVVTLGWGDLQGGPETQWYTAQFAGTSSASPIVAGSLACLQGMCRAEWGTPLNGPLACQILAATGTPYAGPKNIGNRPDLTAARGMLLQGFGTISGTVRDAATQLPIHGVDLLIVEGDIPVRTDTDGHYSVSVLSGTYTVRARDFYHVGQELVIAVQAGDQVVRDIDLQPAPTGYVTGTVLDTHHVPISGAQVQILSTPLQAGITNPEGSYLIAGIPVGGDYTAVIGLAPARSSAWEGLEIESGRGTIVNAVLVDAETFEASNAGYLGSAPWQWGTPSNVGPAGAFSGAKLWATNLSGNYPDYVTSYLTSPPRDVSLATSLTLSFTHYYDFESDFDGGNVQVQVGPNWVTVAPIGGYPLRFVKGLGSQEGYSGESHGWQPAVFDMTPYISSALRFRFHFGSDPGVNRPGWYIDDVALDTGDYPAAVEETDATPSVWTIRCSPNPFRTSTWIHVRPAQDGHISLLILDVRGRVVCRLSDGQVQGGLASVLWDGRDDAGGAVPAGIYYGILQTPPSRIVGRPIIRLP